MLRNLPQTGCRNGSVHTYARVPKRATAITDNMLTKMSLMTVVSKNDPEGPLLIH